MGRPLNRWWTPGGRVFHRLSIRQKLLVLVLVPLAVVLPVLGLLLLLWSGEGLDRLLVTKVRSDLAVAQGYFERTLSEAGASAAAIADSRALHDALEAPAPDIAALLEQLRRRERLDFVNLRHADGRLRATQDGPAEGIDPSSRAYRAIDGEERTSVEVLTLEQLTRVFPSGVPRVAVPLVPTRNAVPTTREVEDRAMVLLSTRAVRDRAGRVVGHIQGGVLLNRNLAFIDHINEIVYPEGSLPFGSRGTATLFLDDVRISTNVRLFGPAQDERAIGTRVSRTVRETVLGQGHTWLDRAFVVNDWYVSAYQPLTDGQGRRVGMLYVGYLERPFAWLKYGVLAGIGVVFFTVMLGASWVSLRWARTIFAPLEQMEATMQQVEAGALDARVGPVDSVDEIGRLAGHLDHLLGVIDENTRRLQRFNAELDAKVVERTRELALAQQQLVRSEKLAAVGQLTASIAHEVNNPIAVMQGNLDLMRELVGPEAMARAGAEMRLLDQQVERMRLIVAQLLQFARPGEYAGYVEAVDPQQALEDCLVLVGPQLAKHGVVVQRDYGAARRAWINRQELQQVLVNLLVNATHAMPQGGELRLATRDVGDDALEITVTDTGAGLGPALIAELFQPFVTRKKDGTGLGLWISRSIVERYGGDLRAADRQDGRSGAVFTVLLKVDGDVPA